MAASVVAGAYSFREEGRGGRGALSRSQTGMNFVGKARPTFAEASRFGRDAMLRELLSWMATLRLLVRGTKRLGCCEVSISGELGQLSTARSCSPLAAQLFLRAVCVASV